MPYAVFGFRFGTFNSAALQIETMKYKHSLTPLPLQERIMRGYGVGAEGLSFLEGKFGSGFENFVLLDDVAIEACKKFKIPFGELVGSIDLNDMGGLAIKLFTFGYWTEG